MKKIVFILVSVICMTAVCAQAQNTDRAKSYQSWKAPASDPDMLRISVLGYVGGNFSESKPLGGIAAALNCYCVRAELDWGVTSLKTPSLAQKTHSFMYFSPSIGLSFGDRYEVYGMVGFTTWGYIVTKEASECGVDKFHRDLVHCRLKAGTNIMITNRLFVNAELSYMFPHSGEGYVYYKNTSLRVGIGYRFGKLNKK